MFPTCRARPASCSCSPDTACSNPGWVVRTYLPAIAQDSSPDPKKTPGIARLGGMFTSPMKAARETRGALGLQSLVSLLLTLEARFYVVTALSNWGALIHELHTVLSEGEGRGHPSLADSYVVNLNHTYAARIRIREFMRIREEKRSSGGSRWGPRIASSSQHRNVLRGNRTRRNRGKRGGVS